VPCIFLPPLDLEVQLSSLFKVLSGHDMHSTEFGNETVFPSTTSIIVTNISKPNVLSKDGSPTGS
jgi:hypothetical protein